MAPHATNFLNAFLLSVVLVIALGKVAALTGLVDRPTSRKVHDGCIPVIGGIAMFAAFLVAILLLASPHAPWGLLAGLFILVTIGLVDDIRDLRPPVRLIAQTTAALVMIVPDWHVVTHLGSLPNGADLALGLAGLPFTLVFVIGIINAYNMLDGLDGLAGGAAAAAFFWLAVAAGMAGHGDHVFVLLLLCATLGFLVFNAPLPGRERALVFMGDAGSTMLGAGIAFFIVALASEPRPVASMPALLWICALPAIDTLSLIARRVMAGQSPLAADRRHLHHLLLKAGLSARRATAVIVLATFVLGGIGMAGALAGTPGYVMLAGLFAAFAGHTWFVHRVETLASAGFGRAAPSAKHGTSPAGSPSA